ncbi:hypothetical protein M2141_003132, partial [Lachnospiraceae bacterium PH5-48]
KAIINRNPIITFLNLLICIPFNLPKDFRQASSVEQSGSSSHSSRLLQKQLKSRPPVVKD